MGRKKLPAQRARAAGGLNKHEVEQHQAEPQQTGALIVDDNDDIRNELKEPDGEELKGSSSDGEETLELHTTSPGEDAEDMLLANTAQAERAISRLSLTPAHGRIQREQEGPPGLHQPEGDDSSSSSESLEAITDNRRAVARVGANIATGPPKIATAVEEDGSNGTHQAPRRTAQDDSPTRLRQMRRQQQEQLGFSANETAARNQPNTGLPSGSSIPNQKASRTQVPAKHNPSSRSVTNAASSINQGPSRQAVRTIAPAVGTINPLTRPTRPNTTQPNNTGSRNRMQGHGNLTGRPLPQHIHNVAETMEVEYTEALNIREAAFHQRMMLINPTLRQEQYELWYDQEVDIYNRTVAAIRARVQQMLETMAETALPHDPEGRVRVEQQRALMEAQRQRDLATQREQQARQQQWNAVNAQQVRGRQQMDQHYQQQQQQQHQGRAPHPQYQVQQAQPVANRPGTAPGTQYHPQYHPQAQVPHPRAPIQGQAGYPLQAPQVQPQLQQQPHIQIQALQPPLPSHQQAHQAQGQAPLLQPQPQPQHQAPPPAPATGLQNSQNPNNITNLQLFTRIATLNSRASLLSTAISEMENTLTGVHAAESRLLDSLAPYQRELLHSWTSSGNAGRRGVALDERIALIRGLEFAQGSEGLNTARGPRMLGIAGNVAGMNPDTGFGGDDNIDGAGQGGSVRPLGSEPALPPLPPPPPQQANRVNTAAQAQPHPQQPGTVNTTTQIQQQPVAMEIDSEPSKENESNKEDEQNDENEQSEEQQPTSKVPMHKRERAANVKSPRGKGGKKQKGSGK